MPENILGLHTGAPEPSRCCCMCGLTYDTPEEAEACAAAECAALEEAYASTCGVCGKQHASPTDARSCHGDGGPPTGEQAEALWGTVSAVVPRRYGVQIEVHDNQTGETLVQQSFNADGLLTVENALQDARVRLGRLSIAAEYEANDGDGPR